MNMIPFEESKKLVWVCTCAEVSWSEMAETIGFLNEQFNSEDFTEDAKVWPQKLTAPDKSPQNLHKESSNGNLSGTHGQKGEKELRNATNYFASFGNPKQKPRNFCVTFSYN